jgi:hypothetical protein
MSQAAEAAADAAILASHPKLTFQSGPYSYALIREGSATQYSVADGRETLSLPILWAFGRGSAEQTYILRIGEDVIESRVSFYSALDALDLTPGTIKQPSTLREAAGRVLDPGSLALCFGCHTTGAVDKQTVRLDAVRVGVRCDNCHEGALRHAAAVLAGDAANAGMKSLKHLSAEKISNFCGRCHRTSEDVLGMNLESALTIRFQPYRLALSRCYDETDERIGCLACHNPHQPVAHKAAAYDSKCLACHAPGNQEKHRVCSQASAGCTACHMPRVELPGAHQSFADHNIRVVRQRTASAK